MKRRSETKENYLKSILHHSPNGEKVSNNQIATHLGTTPASVTDMFNKLRKDELVDYKARKGVSLSDKGRKVALGILRKHRLWELFLVETLDFSWDNVHDIAEQLEHVESPELIKKIDAFLGFPKFDPHGDPIPSEDGTMPVRETIPLEEVGEGQTVRLASVKDDADLLQYLDRVGLEINQTFKVVEKLPFDNSQRLEVNGTAIIISGVIVQNLLVMADG